MNTNIAKAEKHIQRANDLLQLAFGAPSKSKWQCDSDDEPLITSAKGKGSQSKLTLEQAIKNYYDLYHTYYTGYQPPQWVLDNSKQLLKEYGKRAFVLFPDGELDNARKLATEREPVNIGMNREYDMNLLKKRFGYEKGAYERLTENLTKLPPQIAVACVTPIENGYLLDRTKDFKEVAVVSVIGFAFDKPTQPDRRMLQPKGPKSLDEERLLKGMKNVYKLAFAALKYMKRKILCVSPVGDGAFRPGMYNQDAEGFRNAFVLPAVEAAFEEAKADDGHIEWKWAKFKNFTVPESFFDGSEWSEDLENKLYMNAWDPWSILGNGNNNDKS